MKTSNKVLGWLGFAGLVVNSVVAGAKGEAWHTDFEEARALAEEEGKVVMIEFHGSDWCPPCIALNENVLSTEAFQALAEEELILVDADFPRKTKLAKDQERHNRELGKRFGLQVFPTVVLVEPDGTVLEKMTGYPRGGVDGFVESIRDALPDEAAEAGGEPEG